MIESKIFENYPDELLEEVDVEQEEEDMDEINFETPKYFGYARVRDNYLRNALSGKKE